ncbi:RNA polymerase sigma-I factor [Clostridiaceae bacterium 35-E11]
MARLFDILKKDSLTKRLKRVKQGDEKEREKIIQEYIPFIIKTVSDQMNRYIESENSEEYSIGMGAFNEAIDKYEFSRGSFIGFAEMVIKSRITDYFRKNKKHRDTIPISQFQEEEGHKVQRLFQMDDFTDALALKHEIKQLEEKLESFGIDFSDLVKEAPKHKDTRNNGIRIATYIASNQKLMEELLRKKSLPSTKLIQELNITAKILKRSRKFIIATALVLGSDLEILKNYIGQTEGGVINDL